MEKKQLLKTSKGIHRKRWIIWIQSILSLIIVALGQPAWVSYCAPLAAAVGYALFWDVLLSSPLSRKKLFFLASFWFFIVQGVQLSWMSSIAFQGYYILIVYASLALCLGLQFGLFTLFVVRKRSFSMSYVFALASIWTLFEWMRFYVLCGFSWNPVGITLASYSVSMQLASLVGVLGLSFWAIMTNLMALYVKARSFKKGVVCTWFGVALFPYLYGLYVLERYDGELQKSGSLETLLVQPGLLPSQKIPMAGRIEEFISPWKQWESIFQSLAKYSKTKIDLIAFPESAVPFRSKACVYEYTKARNLLIDVFGDEAIPFITEIRPLDGSKVSNAFFCQFLSNYLHADLVIGMDDEDSVERCYSAALHFTPGGSLYSRYAKRVLVPLAEYIPFEWCASLVKAYGVDSFYARGSEAKVFFGCLPMSASICYEETFPHLIREGRRNGALLFVNLTNDNWYPFSKLARQHFDHGKLRAVENGVSLVRSCNSGVTAAVDLFGRTVGKLDAESGVLHVQVPIYHRPTLYTIVGDFLILGLSFSLIIVHLFVRKFFRVRLK